MAIEYINPRAKYDIEVFNRNFKEIEERVNDVESSVEKVDSITDAIKTPEQIYAETRPADWLPMPTPQESYLDLLFHIPDGQSALLAFSTSASNGISVEIGTMRDGEFIRYSYQRLSATSSDVKYQKELFADDYGDLTSDGFKQVIIRINGILYSFSNDTHSKKTLPANYASWNIVEISGKETMLHTLKLYAGTAASTTSTLSKLRYFALYGTNYIAIGDALFSYCDGLQVVLSLYTGKMTNVMGLFYQCKNLIAVQNNLDLSSAPSTYRMFYECNSLIAGPDADTQNIETWSQMYYNCNSLLYVPDYNLKSAEQMINTFYGCSSLQKMPDIFRNLTNAVNISGLFSGCKGLKIATPINAPIATNVSSVFNGCSSLYKIDGFSAPLATLWTSFCSGCTHLLSVSEINAEEVTSANSMFYNNSALLSVSLVIPATKTVQMSSIFGGCTNLCRVNLKQGKPSAFTNPFNNCYSMQSLTLDPTVVGWGGLAIPLNNCSLSHQAIVDFFDSLPTITLSKAITLTGNPGVSDLTDADKAIATEKGWTLTL